MPINLQDLQISIYPNVNDSPVAPTATKGCNGSYLVSLFNALVSNVESSLNTLETEINNLSANSGGKANWYATNVNYNASFNDSILILPSTSEVSIYLPNNPPMGSYVQLFKVDADTEVYIERGADEKLNDSYSWDSVGLFEAKQEVYLFWVGNDGGGWLPSKLDAFVFIGQAA